MSELPRPRRPFCSDAARLRGDDNIATAARVDVWILVELPATWGKQPLDDATMPDAARAALKHAVATIPRSRVVFIRKRVECAGGPMRVYIARSGPFIGLNVIDLPSIDELASLPFRTVADNVRPPIQPLVLVCTHGQHDSCCGRRGYPLFEALRQREEVDVWQCSHIGGDRFAANALILPWGLYYGPVEPQQAPELVELTMRDELLLPGYRGRSGLARPVQAAETFVRRATGVLGRDAYHVVSREHLPDGRTRVFLADTAGATHEVLLEFSVVVDAAFPTCTARAAAPIQQFRLVEYKVH